MSRYTNFDSWLTDRRRPVVNYKIIRILFIDGSTLSLRGQGFEADESRILIRGCDLWGTTIPQVFPTNKVRRVFVGRI